MFKKKIKIILYEKDFIPSAEDLFKQHNYIVLKQSQKLAEEYIKLISQRIKYRHEHGALFESLSRYDDDDIYRFFRFCDSSYTFEIVSLVQDIVFAYFKKLGYIIEWRKTNIRNEDQIYVSWD